MKTAFNALGSMIDGYRNIVKAYVTETAKQTPVVLHAMSEAISEAADNVKESNLPQSIAAMKNLQDDMSEAMTPHVESMVASYTAFDEAVTSFSKAWSGRKPSRVSKSSKSVDDEQVTLHRA